MTFNLRNPLHLMQMMLLAFVLAVVSGCASLGVPTADTTNKKVLEGYGLVTAGANSVATLRAAGKMSDADRDKTVATLQTMKASLDGVAAMAPTDPSAADARLKEVLAVLTALTAALATQQAGGK